MESTVLCIKCRLSTLIAPPNISVTYRSVAVVYNYVTQYKVSVHRVGWDAMCGGHVAPLNTIITFRHVVVFSYRCPVPVDSLSRVLARILTERESPDPQRASANRLGELLILCYSDIFQAGAEVVQEPEDFR